MSWQVLSQQREMQIYWRLCNNSEIHLWLWKVWSLVVCSQSSFYVTGAQKDDKKQTKHDFSLLKKDESGTQRTTITYFNHPNIEKKRIVCGQQSTRHFQRCVLSKM